MICLVRHGETDGNKLNLLQGRSDTVLNSFGQKQAEAVGIYLRQMPWDRIVSSPLKRAYRTAQIIGDQVGIKIIEVDDKLIEKSFGEAEGMMPDERHSKFPDRQYPKMEAWQAVQRRMCQAIEYYMALEENIILVSHGAAINTVLSHYSLGSIGSGKTKLHNASMQMLKKVDGRILIESYNEKVWR